MFHVTIARAGRWPLFEGCDAVLGAVRTTCRCMGRRLVLFNIADDHLHLVVEGTRTEVARRVAGLQLALRIWRRPDDEGRFTERARVRPVKERRHLEHLVPYVIRQPLHHRIGQAPARWPGGCFQDLVGARCVPGFDVGTLCEALPRLRQGAIWAAAEQPVVEPVSLDDLGRFAPAHLVTAAAAVYATGASLRGRRPEVVAARTLAVKLLCRSGLSPAQAARIVGCSERTARAHRAATCEPRIVRAAQLQLALAASVPSTPTRKPSTTRSPEGQRPW